MFHENSSTCDNNIKTIMIDLLPSSVYWKKILICYCIILLPFGDRSFAVAGPHAWNKLPQPLRHVDSAATFKCQLKTFLFDNAFNLHC